jgi:ribonuclease III
MQPLESRIQYKFRNSLLLAEALTHPSLAYESQRPHFDNQRLEFLGDAVLQLAVTEALFKLFPDATEGHLTKLRSRVVSRKALARFATAISLGEYVLLGKGEESTGGRRRISTLADAFESLIGAVYMDTGLESAKELILRLFATEIKGMVDSPDERNPKGELQESLQAIHPVAPVYRIVKPRSHGRTNCSPAAKAKAKKKPRLGLPLKRCGCGAGKIFVRFKHFATP